VKKSRKYSLGSSYNYVGLIREQNYHFFISIQPITWGVCLSVVNHIIVSHFFGENLDGDGLRFIQLTHRWRKEKSWISKSANRM